MLQCTIYISKKKNNEIKFAKDFGILFGLVFQIVDDIIDETENFSILGKTPGKDKKQGKSTLVSITNKKVVIEYCESLIKKFIKKNKKYFIKWKVLEKILRMNFDKIKTKL